MAEVKVSEAKSNVTRAENYFALAKSRLSMLMGASMTAQYDLEEIASEIPKLNVTLDELLSMAQRQRSELKALDQQVEIAKKGINIAWSGFIPQSGIFFQGGYQSGQDFMPDWSWAAGAAASITLWEWGKKYDQIKSAQASYRDISSQRDYAQDGIMLQVKQAYLDLDAADKLIVSTDASVKEAKENHRVLRMKYDAQMATMLEVLSAGLQVSKSEMDYNDNVYDYGVALVRVARAAETTASQISNANALKYYDCVKN
jgi:outer membrane protein TolC